MKSQINSLQAFRGLAALAVVGLHASLSTQAFVSELPDWVGSTIGMGYLGVDFFFVLSGYIIMHAHSNDEKSILSVKKYLFKRSTRVYLPYWPIALFMLLAYAFLPNLSAAGDRDISIVSSLFLLPSTGDTSLSVAWTLIHEIIFYLVFLTFFISSKLFYGILLLWSSLIFTAIKFPPDLAWYNPIFKELNIEFMIGIFSVKVSRLVSARSTALLCTLVGILLASYAAYLLSSGHHHLYRLLFALGMGLLIIGFVYLEKNTSLNWPSVFLVLGNASFSIYLIHNPFLSLSQRFFAKMDFSWPIALFVGIVAATIAGACYYFLVEKRLMQFSKNNMRKFINV